ncbi:proteasome subunit beta type-2-like [Pectinophora gossypiella]|uniref:proteasome subunit beta type-2-like n=1 Tax=Pectinophora gossypiella TaxID=13191 RepID=UPI00214E3D79|nr:proteasome subunit beta type-2-like [Pectinophora gossypiella]
MQPAMFQCLLGMECNDFTMIASDQTAAKSVFILKNDVDKLLSLADRLIMGVNGDYGDIHQFVHFVSNNLSLYKIKNGYELDTTAAVHFARKNLADSYKTGSPFLLNILVAGWDEKEGGQLYLLDHMATCLRMPIAAHGFGGLFGTSILEYYHRRDMTEAQAYEVMQMCVREIHQRLFLNLPNFQVKMISKDGISILPMIDPVMSAAFAR